VEDNIEYERCLLSSLHMPSFYEAALIL